MNMNKAEERQAIRMQITHNIFLLADFISQQFDFIADNLNVVGIVQFVKDLPERSFHGILQGIDGNKREFRAAP